MDQNPTRECETFPCDGHKSLKPFQLPYRSADKGIYDYMSLLFYAILFLQWLQDDFLTYLDKWESSLSTLRLKKKEVNLIMLSPQTLLGLRITGKI